MFGPIITAAESGTITTGAEMNRRSREFWAEQNELVKTRQADENLREYAFTELENEQLRLPVNFQRTLEELFKRAEEVKGPSIVSYARKAAKAQRQDALQDIICEILAERPDISGDLLFGELKTLSGQGRIQQIDDENIWYLVANGKGLKTAKTSGLKDRLTRARKKIRINALTRI